MFILDVFQLYFTALISNSTVCVCEFMYLCAALGIMNDDVMKLSYNE